MIRFLLSIISIFLLQACSRDGEAESVSTVDIRIFLEDRHRVIPAEFEVITEQVLLKEAYREGAQFETVTEQVLEKEGFKRYTISERSDISIVTDASTFLIEEIPCINFYAEANFEETDVPTTYRSRNWQRLFQDGTGTFHDTQYGTIEYSRLVTDAILEEVSSDMRLYEDYRFILVLRHI